MNVEPGTVEALRRVAPFLLFAVAPLVVACAMFAVAIVEGPLAWDFHNELYPQAEALVAGENPYPEALWPPYAALLAAPFTALEPDAADIVFAAVGVACFLAALAVVGVRDWRVYGVALLWPSVIGEIRLSHLTPVLCLLVALAWRHRSSASRGGTALGVAVGLKFFLWPLVLWLAATRRYAAAAVASAVAVTSLLLVVPFAPLDDYLRGVARTGREFDDHAYSLFALLIRLGVADVVARIAAVAVGGGLLVLTWRRRSLALATAAALVLSPIVWLDFFALAAIPLAIVRPRLSPVWFLPLATWGLPSSGIATDAVLGVGRVLLVFALVSFVAVRSEPPTANP